MRFVNAVFVVSCCFSLFFVAFCGFRICFSAGPARVGKKARLYIVNLLIFGPVTILQRGDPAVFFKELGEIELIAKS